ncbi:transcriptional regulator GutM [Amycolatopsis anabasis]|uniref:transcriptional regulator GutM n=1 Tax=Amycolatopsis anabasis TaxID=1840409 RepID=UPI00131C3CF8|nr:transcriptional regulator GutM [Amycolatopsis anabasis]
MTWQAATILLTGFVAAGLLSYRQHLGYQRVVNRVATAENRAGVLLVTGRAKGRLRGAVVLLVIDRRRDAVTRALAMEGASVFARLRERPDLTGPTATLAARTTSKPLREATADALHLARRLAPRSHSADKVRSCAH